jgi:uncharacterized protein (DUF488 family)
MLLANWMSSNAQRKHAFFPNQDRCNVTVERPHGCAIIGSEQGIRQPVKTAALFTFGYEGSSIDAFVERLVEARIQQIVDVRELPLSRKRGFSKTSLGQRLEASGIGYVHVPALGCPKSIRDQYRLDKNWAHYTRDFLAHLRTVQADVRALVGMASEQRACLVCFEADYQACHRTFVARAAHAVGGPPVHHLTAKTVLADAAQSQAA